MPGRILLVGALLLALAGGGAAGCDGGTAPPPGGERTRVVLLGISGADPDIVEALARRGELPAFDRLIREGAWGRLQSISPLLPPVTWTTLATGKNPREHGVSSFLVEDPETGRLRSVPSHLRRAEAVWDVLGARGRRVGVVGWPVTRPPEPVNGTMIPEPAERLPEDDLERLFREEVAAADRLRREAQRIWEEEEPDFLALHVGLLDPICRRFMPYAPPRRDDVSEAEFDEYGGGVLRAYRQVDDMLGEVAGAIGRGTILLVVSTHGMKSGNERLQKPTVPAHRSEIRWHRPYGIFLARGPGVHSGARIRGATIHDVAPTVLGLFGLPRAEDMPGSFLGAAFEREVPEGTAPTYETDRPSRNVARLLGEAAAGGWNPLELPPLDFPGRTLTVSDPLVYGSLLVERGDLEEASRELEKAIRRDPGSSRAFFQLGHCLQRMRKPGRAIRNYRRAAWIDPDFAAAHIRLALLLEDLGFRKEAVGHARSAVAAEPANPVARCHFGQLLLREGRVEEGVRQIAVSLELEPHFPAARNQLGILLVDRGEYAEAEAQFRAAVDLDPEFVRAWNNLGVVVLRRAAATEKPGEREGALDRAEATLDGIVERFPRYAKAYCNRARLRLLRERRGAAREDAAKALELDPGYGEARALLQALSPHH